MALPPFLIPLMIGSGVVTGGLSAASNASSRSQQRQLQNEVLDREYEQALALDKYNWQEAKREYQFRKDEVAIQRLNAENNALFADYQAIQNYQDAVALQDFEYANRIREYAVSEGIYKAQSSLNKLALRQAQRNEDAKYEEAVRSLSYEQQGDYFDFVEAQGAAQNLAGSGRQAQELMGKNLAQYGRNLAVKESELMSTQQQRFRSLETIQQRYISAQIAALSDRKLMPIKPPRPSAPLKSPRPIFQDPAKPVRGPRPVRGVNTVPSYNVFNAMNDFVGGFQQGAGNALSIAGGVKAFG